MAMVEMVFVLPLLILLVFAIAQFGLMFSRWLTLSNAVREGARDGRDIRGPCECREVAPNRVKNKVVSYARAGGRADAAGGRNVCERVCGGKGTPLTVDADLRVQDRDSIRVDGYGDTSRYSSSMRKE